MVQYICTFFVGTHVYGHTTVYILYHGSTGTMVPMVATSGTMVQVVFEIMFYYLYVCVRAGPHAHMLARIVVEIRAAGIAVELEPQL